ncbi:hypothetical protein RUMOBE_03536 [Blautia obeum ATCC 29174]|uniref:Uncharacterized protein n=1 Tax=Blautia obeum ATCC 29174 TaxID=411459 RepID=A5ZWZ2_9FIRM|nr:hypothetical protein RUMOBE_03536 [Blautia obeum ATCC 29174]
MVLSSFLDSIFYLLNKKYCLFPQNISANSMVIFNM